jgi:hypothetical protein
MNETIKVKTDAKHLMASKLLGAWPRNERHNGTRDFSRKIGPSGKLSQGSRGQR